MFTLDIAKSIIKMKRRKRGMAKHMHKTEATHRRQTDEHDHQQMAPIQHQPDQPMNVTHNPTMILTNPKQGKQNYMEVDIITYGLSQSTSRSR